MKIAVAIATRNRPQWLRMFLLQMANQTIKPDVIVIYENGQSRSMKDEFFKDIPIKTDFLFSSVKHVPPDYAIPALKRALEHKPDVVFLMNDDNIYFADHIEKTLSGLQNGKYDVSYHSHGNFLACHGDVLEYFKNIDWAKHFSNMGVDDGFAMSAAAAAEYLSYLEYASRVCKEPSWHPSYGGPVAAVPETNHPSDGVRFARVLHPEREEYRHLRNVNLISDETMSWIHHGANLSSEFEDIVPFIAQLKFFKVDEGKK